MMGPISDDEEVTELHEHINAVAQEVLAQEVLEHGNHEIAYVWNTVTNNPMLARALVDMLKTGVLEHALSMPAEIPETMPSKGEFYPKVKKGLYLEWKFIHGCLDCRPRVAALVAKLLQDGTIEKLGFKKLTAAETMAKEEDMHVARFGVRFGDFK